MPPASHVSAVPRTPPGAAHRNAAGDLVVPAGVGQVVLLPRLWGFDFQVSVDGTVTMTGPGGLVARAEPIEDGGLRVTEVAAESAAPARHRLAAS